MSDLFIDNLECEVKHNDEEILDWSGFSVEEQVGFAEPAFNIDLRRPITVSEGDTATISLGYGSSLITLINEVEINNISGALESRALGGSGTNITNKAPKKSVYFINQTWLEQNFPNYYFRDGIIYKKETTFPPRRHNGVSVDRLFGDYLPGKNIRDAEVTCILRRVVTYHDIARWVANEIGYKIRISVPNLTVQRSIIISAGAPYFQVFSQLFSKYQPLITVDKGEDGTSTINILDVGNDDQERMEGTGTINLTEDSFKVTNWSKVKNVQEVDHLIINGVPSRWTYKYSSIIDGINRKAVAKDLVGTEEVLTFTTDFDDITGMEDEIDKDLWLEYTKNYEMKVTRIQTVVVQKTNPLNGKKVTTREQIISYRGDGTRVHASDTEYKYADYDTIVESETTEYALLGQVGGGLDEIKESGQITWQPTNTYWRKILHSKKMYGDIIGNTGLRDMTIITNGLCFYIRGKRTEDSNDYYYGQGCRPVWIQNQIGAIFYAENNSEDVGAREVFQRIGTEIVRYDIISASLLRKIRVVQTLIPMFSQKQYTEEVPIKRGNISRKEDSGEVEKRWEFYKINGQVVRWNSEIAPSGDFFPRVELNEPDVVTSAEAEQIARRYMARNKKGNIKGTIRLSAPIPGIRPGHTLRLPECKKEILDWNTEKWADTVEIEEGYYWIMGVKQIVQYTGNVKDEGREMEAYTEIMLSQYY